MLDGSGRYELRMKSGTGQVISVDGGYRTKNAQFAEIMDRELAGAA